MLERSLDPSATSFAVWRASLPFMLMTFMVVLLSAWPFRDGLSQMWAWWAASPEESYGVLMPPIAAFLIWQKRDELERMPFTGSWWGIVGVLLGGMLLVIGQLGAVFTVVQYAFVITICGLALALLGWPAFRKIAVPLLFLFFMIPLPQFVLANLSARLQLLSSQLGVALMRMFDISVFVEGNVIDLGGYKLQVAEACSGLRYLFPLMAIGFLMAYFYRAAPWKRISLFLSSVPITVFMNSFRVAIIGITVEHWGIGMAEGFLHEFQGWVIFMMCIAIMLGEIALLNRIGRESGSWRQRFGIEFPPPAPPDWPIRRRAIPPSLVGAAVVLVMFVAGESAVPRPVELIPKRLTLADFPLQFGDWRGKREALEAIYLEELKLDDYLLANYESSERTPVNLYIAYYDSQRKGEAVHSPRSCLPGGGWQLREFGQRSVPNVTVGGMPLRVNRTLISLGNDRELVYYWFQQRGRVITNEYVVKWFLFWDALTRHRSDGALIRLIAPLPPSTDTATADRRLTEFAARIISSLPAFVPD